MKPDFVTVAQMLEAHARYANEPMSLPNCLGDGLFLHFSRIARRVREEILNSRFLLTEPQTSLEKDLFYQSHILLLPYQFEKGVLFWKNNVHTVKALVDQFPPIGKMDVRYIIVPYNSPAENKLLHEGIHLLSFDRIFSGSAPYRHHPDFSAAETQNWLLKHLAVEGTVLALELMSTLVKPSFENIYLTHLSCHQTAAYPLDFNTLLRAQQELGLEEVFYILARGFLVANLIPRAKEVTPAHLNFVAGGRTDELTMSLVMRSQKLGEGFRIESNTRYFASLGYPGCFEEEVLSRPVESYFEPPTINEIFKMNYRRFLA